LVIKGRKAFKSYREKASLPSRNIGFVDSQESGYNLKSQVLGKGVPQKIWFLRRGLIQDNLSKNALISQTIHFFSDVLNNEAKRYFLSVLLNAETVIGCIGLAITSLISNTYS